MTNRILSRQFHGAEGAEAWRVLPDGHSPIRPATRWTSPRRRRRIRPSERQVSPWAARNQTAESPRNAGRFDLPFAHAVFEQRLTATALGATLGATEQFHRLRGGVKIPTGGRLLEYRSQPANPGRPGAAENGAGST
jgi:hypothetical protein